MNHAVLQALLRAGAMVLIFDCVYCEDEALVGWPLPPKEWEHLLHVVETHNIVNLDIEQHHPGARHAVLQDALMRGAQTG